MRTYAKVVVSVFALLTVTAGVLASIGTVFARRYSARTSEGFVYVYVLFAWTGVLILAVTTAGLTYWFTRRARRDAMPR